MRLRLHLKTPAPATLITNNLWWGGVLQELLKGLGGKGEGGLQARLHDIETSLDLAIGQLEAVLAHTQQVAVSGAERAEGHLLKVVQVKAEQSCWMGFKIRQNLMFIQIEWINFFIYENNVTEWELVLVSFN